MRKFLTDYLQYKLSHILGGHRDYEKQKLQRYALQNARLNNKDLAKELEEACRHQKGPLTYAEYLAITQSGRHGYHAKNRSFGKTNVHKRWPEAIIEIVQKYKIAHILDIGCGDCSLGEKILEASLRKKLSLSWTGVDINEALLHQAITKFKKKFPRQLWSIVKSIDDVLMQEKTLVIFAYSLDSIPPEMFLKTSARQTFPDRLIGVNVQKNIISENFLFDNDLNKRKITFRNGIYKNERGEGYNLRSMSLYQGQRIYLPLSVFSLVQRITNILPDESRLLIIDEFLPQPLLGDTSHLGVPQTLATFTRSQNDLQKAYEEAGEHLLYYPFFYTSYLDFLKSIGLSISYEGVEQKLASDFSKKKWVPEKRFYHTMSILTGGKQKNIPTNFVYHFQNPSSGSGT